MRHDAVRSHDISPRLLWPLALLLISLGVYSSIARALILGGHSSSVADAPRLTASWLFPAYAAEFVELDAHFAQIPLSTYLHVLVGAVFLACGALQFSATIRSRHPRVHRYSGRGLVALAAIVGPTGLWMGIVAPFSITERLPTVAIGVMFLASPVMAIAAIRRGDVRRHREWMLRFYAAGISVAVVRLLSPAVVWVLDPVVVRAAMGATFWTGWIVTQSAAELWIRFTRPRQLRHALA